MDLNITHYKEFIQKFCIFLGLSLLIIACSFGLIDNHWCQYTALILALMSVDLIGVTLIHMTIFG